MIQSFRSIQLSLFVLVPLIGLSQWSGTPVGKPLVDSLVVGKVFSYALSYGHSSETEVYFPDSTYNFYPFEFKSQKLFTTFTGKQGSLDSTVYDLVLFDVLPRPTIQLPVFVANGRDCTTVFSNTDTLRLSLVSKVNLGDTELREEEELLQEGFYINYSQVVFTAVAFFIAAGLIYWFFKEEVNRQWKLFKLFRRNREFVRAFNKLAAARNRLNRSKSIERAVIVWKEYLQRLLNRPFSTYTTREISDYFRRPALSGALKEADRTIYGQAESLKSDEALLVLMEVSQVLYQEKRREIKLSGQVKSNSDMNRSVV